MRTLVSALLLVAIGAMNLSLPSPTVKRQPPGQFVTARAMQLTRNGEPLRLVGVNCYRLAEYADWCDTIFDALATNGVGVVRFWAFQRECGPSGTDFSRFEAIVASARRHDILLMPVLENHWGACTDVDEPRKRDWYVSGWRQQNLGPLTFCDYIRAVGTHFRDEPQILAWQLVNEPEIWPDTDENFATLRQFAIEAAGELKAVDPNHLVSLGLLGIGQPSSTGRRFRALHQNRHIDLVTAHDHGYIYEAMPGRNERKPRNIFYANLLDARALRKPFLATESCVPLPWLNGDEQRRVELFRAKLDAFFAEGGSACILWNYEPTLESDCGIGPDEPVMGLLREYAARLK